MAIDIVAYKKRIKAIYEEAFLALESENADVGTFPLYVSEKMPYVTLRTGNVDITGDGDEVDVYEIEIIAEVYADWVSANAVDGEAEETIDRWIVGFVQYFNERELLQSQHNDSSVDYRIAPDNIEYARVTNSSGYRQTQTGGATPEGKKLTTFRHFIRARELINQVYN